jgi:hypothetical protein
MVWIRAVREFEQPCRLNGGTVVEESYLAAKIGLPQTKGAATMPLYLSDSRGQECSI